MDFYFFQRLIHSFFLLTTFFLLTMFFPSLVLHKFSNYLRVETISAIINYQLPFPFDVLFPFPKKQKQPPEMFYKVSSS